MKFIELTEEQFAPIYKFIKESVSLAENVLREQVKSRLENLGVVESDDFISYLISTVRSSENMDSFQLAFRMFTQYTRIIEPNKVVKKKKVGQPLSGTTNAILRPRASDFEALAKMRAVFKSYGSDKDIKVSNIKQSRQNFNGLSKFQKPFVMKAAPAEIEAAENSISFLNLIDEEVQFTEEYPVETFLHSEIREEVIYLDSVKIINGEIDKLVDIAFPIDSDYEESKKAVRELQFMLTDPMLFSNLIDKVLSPFVSKGRTTYDRGPILSGVEMLDNMAGVVPASSRVSSLIRGICAFLFHRTGLVSGQFQFTDVEAIRYPELGAFKVDYIKNLLLREEIKASIKELVSVAMKLEWTGLVLVSDVSSRFFKLCRAVGRDLDRCELLESAFKISLMVATDKLLAQHSRISQLNLHNTSSTVNFLVTNYEFINSLAEYAGAFSGVLLSNAGLSFEETQLLNWLDRRFAAVREYVHPITEASSYVASYKLGGEYAYVRYEDLGSKNAKLVVSKVVDYSNGGQSVSMKSREGLSQELTNAYKGLLSAVDHDFANTLKSALVLTGSPDYISFTSHRNEFLSGLIAASQAGSIIFELLDYAGQSGEFKLRSLGNRVYKLPVEKLRSIRNELIGDLFFTRNPDTYLAVIGFENGEAKDFERSLDSLDALDNRDLVFSSLFTEKNFLDRKFNFKLPVADKTSDCELTVKDLFPYELVEYAELLILNTSTTKNSARLDLLLQAGEFSALFAKGGAKDVIRANSFYNILSEIATRTSLAQKIAQQIYYMATRQWMAKFELYTADLAGVEMNRLHNSCVATAILIINELVQAYEERLLARLVKEASKSALWLTQKL